jgi:hypothetical protein
MRHANGAGEDRRRGLQPAVESSEDVWTPADGNGSNGDVLLVAGGLSVLALSAGDAEGGASSGALLVPGGVAMVACAVVSLRGGPRRGRPERWGRRAIGALAVALSLMWIVMPLGAALYVSGKPRAAVPESALGIPHLDYRQAGDRAFD